MIALAFRDSLPQGVADELDQLVQGLVGMLYREHNPEGGHTNITADSMTMNAPNLTKGVSGAITFKDRLGRTSTLYRDLDNASGDSILRLNSGVAFRIQRTDVSGVLYNLIGLGLLTYGNTSGNGIKLYGKNPANDTSLTDVFHDWSIISGDTNASPGARMLIGDDTRSISPVSLRWRRTGDGIYELMKTTGGSGPTLEQVNLGSSLDSSLAGFWDNAYIKNLVLATGAGSSSAGLGAWTNGAFSAGDYTATGAMTWTVIGANVTTLAYRLVGPSMLVAFYISSTDVGGTPDQRLKILIPGGFTAQKDIFNACQIISNGVGMAGYALVGTGDTHIYLGRSDLANWPNGVGNNGVFGQIEFPIA